MVHKQRETLLVAPVYLELSRVHADVDVLVGLVAVLQVVKGLDLVQGVQQTPAEEADPQHAGRVHAELEAVQLSVQVGGRHWRSRSTSHCYHYWTISSKYPMWLERLVIFSVNSLLFGGIVYKSVV